VTGDREVDADVIDPSLALMAVVRFDHDPAAGNAVVESLKLLGPFSDQRFGRRRGVHSSERNLQWKFHE
jgi:hypothetical protein